MAMTPKEMIEVLQHFVEGGQVEHLCGDGKWRLLPGPVWNFSKYDYRIKPKPLERWINVCDKAQDDQAYETKEIARMAACKFCRTVHMREVLGD